MIKYFLKTPWNVEEIEVSKEEFIKAEEISGFFGKIDGETATWNFSNSKTGLSGRQQKIYGEKEGNYDEFALRIYEKEDFDEEVDRLVEKLTGERLDV
jgi:hypothetical protein